MTEIQGKLILVRVSARFELVRVPVIRSRLYTHAALCYSRTKLSSHGWIFCFLSCKTRSSTRFSIVCSRFSIRAGIEKRIETRNGLPTCFWTVLYLCYPSLPCLTLLPFVTLCYPALPSVTLCYSLFPCVTLCYPVLLCVTMCSPVLPCATLCSPVFPSVTLCYPMLPCLTLCYLGGGGGDFGAGSRIWEKKKK